MNVNELTNALTNIQMSFKDVKDQIAFTNAEVMFDRLSIKDVVYEDNLVKLRAFKWPKIVLEHFGGRREEINCSD